MFCIEPSKVAWKSMEQLFDLDKPAQIVFLGNISESICQVRCATGFVASSYGISWHVQIERCWHCQVRLRSHSSHQISSPHQHQHQHQHPNIVRTSHCQPLQPPIVCYRLPLPAPALCPQIGRQQRITCPGIISTNGVSLHLLKNKRDPKFPMVPVVSTRTKKMFRGL